MEKVYSSIYDLIEIKDNLESKTETIRRAINYAEGTRAGDVSDTDRLCKMLDEITMGLEDLLLHDDMAQRAVEYVEGAVAA